MELVSPGGRRCRALESSVESSRVWYNYEISELKASKGNRLWLLAPFKVLYTSPHPEIHPIPSTHLKHHSATCVFDVLLMYHEQRSLVPVDIWPGTQMTILKKWTAVRPKCPPFFQSRASNVFCNCEFQIPNSQNLLRSLDLSRCLMKIIKNGPEKNWAKCVPI